MCGARIHVLCARCVQRRSNGDTAKVLPCSSGGRYGGGYYYVDTNCTVTAVVPEGKQFIKWVSGETDLSANAEYTFTVTKNIKLKAVFEDDIPDITLYTVNVRWGNGSGNYFAGKKVNVSVVQDYVGATFTGWEATYKVNGEDVTEVISTQASFELTVDKDIDITARYNAVPLATPTNDNGQMFCVAANGAYEFARQKTSDGSKMTAFVPGCAFLLYTAYVKNGDNELVKVGQGKVVPLPKQEGEYYHYMYSLDGKTKGGLKGGNGNIYQDTPDAKATIRAILGMELNNTYYITAQAKGSDDSPIDSKESAAFAVRL